MSSSPKIEKALFGTGQKYHYFDNKEEIGLFHQALLEWFDTHQRDLPWRRKLSQEELSSYQKNPLISKNEKTLFDPNSESVQQNAYFVWVSEIMLCQTQVVTVIDYFNRWIEKFPSLKSLAESSLDEVNQMWSGLGYYSRAKNLRAGAIHVVENLQSKIPSTVASLLKIPGIGDYTAGAISSIAFSHTVPALDGNVNRVMSRLRSIGETNIVSRNKIHCNNLTALVEGRKRPGCFNQALMELGALICTPKNPKCDICPVSRFCTSRSKQLAFEKKKGEELDSMGDTPIPDMEDLHLSCSLCSKWGSHTSVSVLDFPPPKKKVDKKLQRIYQAIVVDENQDFLLVKRPSKGILANLLDFPQVVYEEDEIEDLDEDDCISALKEKISSYFTKLATTIQEEKVDTYTHILTHIKQHFIVYKLQVPKAEEDDMVGDCCWKSESLIRQQSQVPKSVIKALDCLQKQKAPKKVKARRKESTTNKKSDVPKKDQKQKEVNSKMKERNLKKQEDNLKKDNLNKTEINDVKMKKGSKVKRLKVEIED